MSWSDAVPNLLIGLREGLEAGLVVSILLAALAKTADTGRRVSSLPVWLGVLAAVMVAGSFAAVITYSTSVLSSWAQEAVGGILSVLAVGLVTGMVFWMRRTAAGLAAQLRGEVDRAVTIGAGALALTAFLAVGREGLETTLFIWAAVKASGQTASPLFGAAAGLLAAIVLCTLLYHRAVRLDLGVFFRRTALALIVIAAGVLAYGLGDIQEASFLPGQRWVAFDVANHIDPSSWWASIISGITELSPQMTVLQVVAWVGYLMVVIPMFVLAGRRSSEAASSSPPRAAKSRSEWWVRLAAKRPWSTAAALIVVPVTAAAVTIAVLPTASAATTTSVTVTRTACADSWTSGHSGRQTFAVNNKSGKVAEVNLDNASGGVVAEIETLGPGTNADMAATLGAGSYHFACLLSGAPPATSASVQVSGAAQGQPAAVAPLTLAELTGPNDQYQAYAARDLAALAARVKVLTGDLQRDDLAVARNDWLGAQMDWELVGASYDSFGDMGLAIDGLPDGLPEGVADPAFTGLHRLEYGLWNGQGAAVLVPLATTLSANIAKLQQNLNSADIAGDPTNLPIRAHEILEDALRDHLSGIDDLGADAAYPETYADTQVTQVVLAELAPLITARSPHLLAALDLQLAALQAALGDTKSGGGWKSPGITPLMAGQQVDASIGSLLESLSSVPDLLEIPPAS